MSATSSIMKPAVEKSGLTHRELAERAGLAYSSFHRYLHGMGTPHPRRVPFIAAALGCDAGELLAAVHADRGVMPASAPEARLCFWTEARWQEFEARLQRLRDFVDLVLEQRRKEADILRACGIELPAAPSAPQAAEQSEDGQEAGACAQSAGVQS